MTPAESAAATAQGRHRWLIYALGGGMGHLTRAWALARRAVSRGVAVRILSNSPFAAALAARRFRSFLPDDPGIVLLPLPATGPSDIVVEAVRRELLQSPPPDVLIVDTFPRGLAGELVDILPAVPARKVLVHRRLNPDYVRWADLEAFVSHYDLLLVPGEDVPLAHLPQARHTDPWLICHREELWTRDAARTALGVQPNDARPLIVVLGSGKPDEARAAARAAVELEQRLQRAARVRFVSCDEAALAEAGETGIAFWPMLPLLTGVDLLLGSGGYNTVHEARATATPLIAIAQPRLYDEQSARLQPEETCTNWEQALDRAEQAIHALPLHKSRPAFPDGAEHGASLIADLECEALSSL